MVLPINRSGNLFSLSLTACLRSGVKVYHRVSPSSYNTWCRPKEKSVSVFTNSGYRSYSMVECIVISSPLVCSYDGTGVDVGVVGNGGTYVHGVCLCEGGNLKI